MKFCLKSAMSISGRVGLAALGLAASVVVNVSAAERATRPSGQAHTGAEAAARVAERLRNRFDRLLADPEGYAAKVRRECREFPEGDLFPFVFPVFAYTDLAVADASNRPLALKQIPNLIDMAVASVTRRVRPPGGRLENLRSFNRHATYLGQLNVALGCYSLVGGDRRYEKIHRAVSDVLHRALVRRSGRPLESLPTLTWPFDTIPCLLSLKLYDRHTSKARSGPIIARHLEWVRTRATDKAMGLPYSRANIRTGRSLAPPRGCDLSLRICFLANVDRDEGARLYRNYVKSFFGRIEGLSG